MPETILLRFSDYETDTIGAHLRVIAQYQMVWWGWWKKEHEPFPADVLQQVAATVPFDLGLVDRRERVFHVARCDELRLDPQGERTPSPDPERTPAYYRQSMHPTWLRLTAITPIAETEWIERFGGIPEGDPTLFWVEEEEGRRRIHPTLVIEGELESPGASILHISDLHYGEDHGFSTEGHAVGLGIPTMIDAICDRVEALDESIALVVVSGDLITKGREESYAQDVQPMLERLLDRLGLEKPHMVIVPGNHDIEIAPDELSPTPTQEYRHERRFRYFLRSFYGRDIHEIESLHRIRTAEDWHISVVGLNSVRLRTPDTKEYGYVGDRSEPLLQHVADTNEGRTVGQLAQESVLNIVALHHHLLPGELLTQPERNRPVSVTLDAGHLVSDCQAAGIHLVVHGHQHVPFLGSTSRARLVNGAWGGYIDPLFVIGGGSGGAASTRLPDEMRQNTFSIYRPGEGALAVRVEQFNPSVAATEYMRLNIPLTG
jgi:3',5'-cyclic AMP phosphodiesterase CpdA